MARGRRAPPRDSNVVVTQSRQLTSVLPANSSRPRRPRRRSALRPSVSPAVDQSSVERIPNARSALAMNSLNCRSQAAPSPGASRSNSATLPSSEPVMNAAEPSGKAVPVGRSVLTYSTPRAVELVLELGVGGGAGEERMPRREHLVGEAGQGQIGRGADAAAGDVVPLEHADAPAFPRQQRGSDQRVDPRADEHRIEGRHRAMLQNRFRLDMSPPGVRPIEACFYERSSTRVRQPSRRRSPSSPSTTGHVPSQAARRSST